MADEEAGQTTEQSMSSEAPNIYYEKSWLSRKCSSHIMRDRQAQKSGQLFSGLLAMNVLFLGTALISSSIFNKKAITSWHVQIFLSILMVFPSCWMLYYQVITTRKPHAVLYKDPHAGAFWLRGSLILFGACSILLHVFKTGFEATSTNCLEPVRIIFPILEILFISIQTSLLLFFCKNCTQVQHTITRYGLTLTLATDLLLWVLMVSDESVKKELESTSHSSELFSLSDNATTCECSDICLIFKKGYVTLHPFYLEYCLICCSMLFVMWKNVGRRISHPSNHAPPKLELHGVVFGPLLGSFAVFIGLSIFIIYQIQATASELTQRSFVMYYSYCITLLPIMALCCVSGTIIHSLEERELDTHKNPTRSLDVVLLLGASLGPFAVSYYSIVACLAMSPRGQLNSLNLAYSVIIIVEHIAQNIFIIEGLRGTSPAQCGSAAPARPQKINSYSNQHFQQEESTAPPAGQSPMESDRQNVIETERKTSEDKVDSSPRRFSVLETRRESLQNFRRVSHAYLQNYTKLKWKKRALKELSVFLIFCNIILWIMPAFGAQPQFENGLEKTFYGRSTWFTILNFGLPLGIFYRMHVIGGLLEIYLSA